MIIHFFMPHNSIVFVQNRRKGAAISVRKLYQILDNMSFFHIRMCDRISTNFWNANNSTRIILIESTHIKTVWLNQVAVFLWYI